MNLGRFAEQISVFVNTFKSKRSSFNLRIKSLQKLPKFVKLLPFFYLSLHNINPIFNSPYAELIKGLTLSKAIDLHLEAESVCRSEEFVWEAEEAGLPSLVVLVHNQFTA